ncbi:MAG TPA: beta-ketoacyl-[acyl-carrier-protein] synthase family protein [Candidatus Omnitrophota bacterium]|nr:beta-ketoacyl-[acyl-carrier-protein] synthase family protein [Candidatus Omnitrophota bacterium]
MKKNQLYPKKSKRVVITGLGVISPIGNGKDVFWKNLISGKNGIGKIESFDTTAFKTCLGGEVKDFLPSLYIKKVKIPSCCRLSQLAVSAANLAYLDSALSGASFDPARTGVICSSATADSSFGEESIRIWEKKGYRNTPVDLAKATCWLGVSPSNYISSELGFFGLNMSIPVACAAGNYGIAYGFDLIRNGKLDIVFAGGADCMNQLVLAGFERLRSLSPDKCRPFDRNRKGLIVGEGAAILVLEELEHAISRRAKIYAELAGYGLGSDAYHPTAPHPEGRGALKAIKMAFRCYGIKADQVDYINAHGTGTIANDRIETLVIKKIFGKKAKKIPVSSIKSMLGHTMGAASAIEAAACALTVKHGIIPPTINYETPDPECDLDYVPNRCRKQRVNLALSNSFAFGGNVGVLFFGKFNG